MDIRKFTAIALLLACTLLAQAVSAVDHVHLDVSDEKECLICGSSANDALLGISHAPAVVPVKSDLIKAIVRASHQRIVLDRRSRAPPITLAS